MTLRAELVNGLASLQPHTLTGAEMKEQALALIALSSGLPNEKQILNDLLEQMTRRNWWYVNATAFVELIPRLPAAGHSRAVTTALHQCFEDRGVEELDRLLSILNAEELAQAFTELPRISDHHTRAGALAAVMRRAGAIARPAPVLDGLDLVGQLPAKCTQAEFFAIITASAWWIERNGGTAASSAIAGVMLDIVRRRWQLTSAPASTEGNDRP
jgi:hypothetical protein